MRKAVRVPASSIAKASGIVPSSEGWSNAAEAQPGAGAKDGIRPHVGIDNGIMQPGSAHGGSQASKRPPRSWEGHHWAKEHLHAGLCMQEPKGLRGPTRAERVISGRELRSTSYVSGSYECARCTRWQHNWEYDPSMIRDEQVRLPCKRGGATMLDQLSSNSPGIRADEDDDGNLEI